MPPEAAPRASPRLGRPPGAGTTLAASIGRYVEGHVGRVKQRQKHLLVDRVVERVGDDLQGRVFAPWGLAFKPGTD